MTARVNGMWDFNSYDEKTWFRFLVIKLILTVIIYFILHVVFFDKKLNYEYSSLNKDQIQFINRIYMDALDPQSSNNLGINGKDKVQQLGQQAPPINTKGASGVTVTPNNLVKPPTRTLPKPTIVNDVPSVKPITPVYLDSARKVALSARVMDYLNTVFENKLDNSQAIEIHKFIEASSPQQIITFLAATRYKIKSYFWLIGPCVYWEIVFWAIFGVLSNLLFNLGAVGSSSTTNLMNPQSQFDPTQIFGQVGKILYAPLCTLIVVLGYNYFKDQNVVDISSSKGVIVFAFIGGFYSGRLIALMDRLKDVLMPNAGTASLPTLNDVAGKIIPVVTVKVTFAGNASPDAVAVAGLTGINNATVTMRSTNDTTLYTATRSPSDPIGVFSFTGIPAGNYLVTATLVQALPNNTAVSLTGQLNGQILTPGTALLISIS